MIMFVLSGIVGSLGVYYLWLGKRRGDGNYMLIGGGLIIASYFLF